MRVEVKSVGVVNGFCDSVTFENEDGKEGKAKVRQSACFRDKIVTGATGEAEFENWSKNGGKDYFIVSWNGMRDGPRGTNDRRPAEDTYAIIHQVCIKAAKDIKVAQMTVSSEAAETFDIDEVMEWASKLFHGTRKNVQTALEEREE